MQVFKTDKKLFWINELKSWLWLFGLSALLYFILMQFSSIANENVIIGVVIMLLLKIADTFTQYHAKEIQIDELSNRLTVLLNSRMSGEKVEQYKLDQVTSELISNSGLTKYLISPDTLKLHFRPNRTWVINTRFGFTPDTLIAIDKQLKTINSKL